MISRKLPRAKPPKSRMLFTGLSCGIEVEEPRYRVQFLFQNQHTLVLDDVADLTVFVEEIIELLRARRAHFDTRRIAPGTAALDAEGALFDDALGPRAVAQVVRVGVEFLVGNFRLLPVEMPRAIGASRHAVTAADAPVVIDHHDAVAFGPGGAGGAYLGARRVLAMLAPDGHVEMSLFGNVGGVVVCVGVREVDALVLLHRHHANPLDLRIARLIVLGDAGIHAAPAADAAGDVQGIGKLDAGNRTGVRDRDFLAVAGAVLRFHLFDGGAKPVFGRLVEALRAARRHDPTRRGGRRGDGEQPARRMGRCAVGFHGEFSLPTAWCGWAAWAPVWAPVRGIVAGAGYDSWHTTGIPWLRSNFRCGVRARLRANRAVSPHDIGRRRGMTRRREPAHRWPDGGSRGWWHRGNPDTSDGSHRASTRCRCAWL